MSEKDERLDPLVLTGRMDQIGRIAGPSSGGQEVGRWMS